MKCVKFITFCNKNGEFPVEKEYTLYLRPESAKIMINDVSRVLKGDEAKAFVQQIKSLHLENVTSSSQQADILILMKWEMFCTDGENPYTAQGVNTIPHSLVQLVKTADLFIEDYLPQSDLLHTAIRFATDAHAGQLRKGSDVPYIVHPMEVLQLLTDMNSDENLQIAGVLHDVVEDTPVTIEQVEEIFGREVARLVASHTEEKGKSWREQKRATIEIVKNADKPVQMLIMADKISNLKSMLYDYLEKGEALWRRFGSTKEMQAWHNSRLIDALYPLSQDADTASHYYDMKNLFMDLYADFYIEWNTVELYQHIAGVGTWKYNRDTARWTEADSIPADAEKITPQKATKLIDLWNEL
ncbi:MAG: bifunctional (p)ppGpp synthetase/guanosine-3',5'-bis(diphosphate) 3'-pyrophosphohydrolase [Oscillospiraceae bacterium]|nr:bifunctional (p)ppGpp synthetase/guanosine-3',5'-bis(diphosphate) 3'-pyrophosphohydrolase [Oscillospiraceae bacterium]